MDAKFVRVTDNLDEVFFLGEELVIQFIGQVHNGVQSGVFGVKLLGYEDRDFKDSYTPHSDYVVWFGGERLDGNNKFFLEFNINNIHYTLKKDLNTQDFNNGFRLKLILRSDNTYQLFRDYSLISSGSLEEDVTSDQESAQIDFSDIDIGSISYEGSIKAPGDDFIMMGFLLITNSLSEAEEYDGWAMHVIRQRIDNEIQASAGGRTEPEHIEDL
mmetsp:Transcript_8594/g.9759  ORF Transcript_8594/g.9759 Transcript_8594/m.9759 type:complete len:215 (+) Transcript_8594:233-877(+)|eukprot:CAMPEP_0205822938 /NCGR_PEP_ID=MMETSP0206-20130828/14526_1 /ASSEMBLY_ACC=CAM_ASM_000279 /TAXON_ID=36767 /ORGANISM="Euplotes focardii, Strain TN1" /LENGTH=214 /DNA_ID=CAMNT_0053119635 /DNA_START=159 /DNA_END=803 /DNA_ORIENTATION=+